jgi:hypothetical protein
MKASLTRCFSKFTTAAIVVGVGLLLFAAPLEAKVVYTSANIQVGPGSNSYQLDANNDGIADFTIYNFLSRSTGCQKDAQKTFSTTLRCIRPLAAMWSWTHPGQRR